MTAQRLAHGGRIDRNAPIEFSWNGRTLRGYRGDTLASALLANNQWLLARSFKYHRPRGVTSAGVEESGALVTLGEGARRDPNVKASTQELFPHLVARAQNAWPSVQFDCGAIANVFSRFLPAGFYYKTFMGPRIIRGTAVWMQFEKLIRRAAGLGESSRLPDPDEYEHAHAFCDVLVIGGGVAGLSAAAAAAKRAGLDVLLVEQDFELGGALLNQPRATVDAQLRALIDAARGVRIMTRTTAFGLYDHGVAGLCERVGERGDERGDEHSAAAHQPRLRCWTVRARRTIIAAGAIEQPIAFGNNDRPGVLGADAARAYLNRYALRLGKRIVIATNNDSPYPLARELTDAGGEVTVLDARTDVDTSTFDLTDIRAHYACAPLRVRGTPRVTALEFAEAHGDQWRYCARLPCDVVLVSGGWAPTLHLHSQRGITPIWNEQLACFLPGEAGANNKTLHIVGAAAGIWRNDACIASGRIAGARAAAALGVAVSGGNDVNVNIDGGGDITGNIDIATNINNADNDDATVDSNSNSNANTNAPALGVAVNDGNDVNANIDGGGDINGNIDIATNINNADNDDVSVDVTIDANDNAPALGGWRNPIRPLFEVHGRAHRLKSFVDLQNDVTTDDIRLAKREGYVSVEHLKRYTTLGMSTDGGKFGNIIGASIMATARGVAMSEVGVTTFRPPYTPIAIGALRGRNVGRHFRPLRRTPMHDWNLEHGATMTIAGLWERPWHFARDGETIEDAYIREARTVRNSVGLCDVTSLGKIAVQGVDAAEFLNRVYVNAFAKLPIGKARYGVMLRDDGAVLDDGTTWRLSEFDYFMTTTTAQAGAVMTWLEELLQTRWANLNVRLTSVSEQWGGCALAGPKSREVLRNCVVDAGAVENDALPFMGVVETRLRGDIPCRIARISFSGERAYEVYTPSDYAVEMSELLWREVRAHDGCLYGTEALGTLRIEKGHVTAAELDGRVTLTDAGLGAMASQKKSFIGDALRKRDELLRDDRPRLVGIKPVRADDRFNAGAILCAGEKVRGHGDGWISAVTHSPALGHWIGLGFISGGHQVWQGRRVVAADPVRNRMCDVEVTSPHMVDPSGERMHG